MELTNEELLNHLDDPIDGEEWEKFASSKNVVIYKKKKKEQSDLLHYKVLGTVAEITPEECFKVSMDTNYRRYWDAYAKQLYEYEKDGRLNIYWEVKYPLLMANRDYIFYREPIEIEFDSTPAFIIRSHNVDDEDIPAKDGTIRVTQFEQVLVMTANKNGGTDVYMEYYDNSAGNMPDRFVNHMAKHGLPQFVTSLKKACKGYDEFLARQRRASEEVLNPKDVDFPENLDDDDEEDSEN